MPIFALYLFKIPFLKEKYPFSNINRTNSLVDQEGSNVVFFIIRERGQYVWTINTLLFCQNMQAVIPKFFRLLNMSMRTTTYCVTEMTALYVCMSTATAYNSRDYIVISYVLKTLTSKRATALSKYISSSMFSGSLLSNMTLGKIKLI